MAQQLFKNILSSWGIFLLRALTAFLFTPFIAGVLGEARFGVWALVFAALDYLALSELGLKQSLIRFIAKFSGASGAGDSARANKAINSVWLVSLGLAALAFGAGMIIVSQLGNLFSFSDALLLTEAQQTLLVVLLQLSLVIALGPLTAPLEGLQRFDLANRQNMVVEILRVALYVAALMTGYGLVTLAWILFATTAIKQVWAILDARKISVEFRIDLKNWDGDLLREILGYARISFLITLLWLLIFRVDSFLLGATLGIASIGIYAPAAQIFHYLKVFVNAIGAPLIPAVTQLESSGAKDRLADVYLKGVGYVSFVTALFASGCVIYARDFVRLWLPEEFAPAAEVMIILAPAAAVYLPQIIGESILFGSGNHRLLLYLLIAEAISKITLSLALVESHGLNGIALGSAAPQVVLYLFVYPLLMRRAIGVSPLRSIARFLRFGLIGAGLTVLLSLTLKLVMDSDSWVGLGAHVAAIGIVALGFGYLMLEFDDKQRVKHFLRS